MTDACGRKRGERWEEVSLRALVHVTGAETIRTLRFRVRCSYNKVSCWAYIEDHVHKQTRACFSWPVCSLCSEVLDVHIFFFCPYTLTHESVDCKMSSDAEKKNNYFHFIYVESSSNTMKNRFQHIRLLKNVSVEKKDNRFVFRELLSYKKKTWILQSHVLKRVFFLTQLKLLFVSSAFSWSH